MTEVSLVSPLGDHLYLLGTIAGGVAMGFWYDLIAAKRSVGLLVIGVVALGLGAIGGQEWAGIALGCLLGARAMSMLQAEK